jgi:hypothetical protein
MTLPIVTAIDRRSFAMPNTIGKTHAVDAEGETVAAKRHDLKVRRA